MDKPYKYCNYFNEFKNKNFTLTYRVGLRGAMVARLTPDQKAACSSHVGVTEVSVLFIFFLSRKYQFSFGLTKNRFRESFFIFFSLLRLHET